MSEVKKITVVAKGDFGVPARKWIIPVAPRSNKAVWPAYKNDVLIHNGPLIVKGELYEIPEDKFESVKDLFEKIKEQKKEK